MDDLAPVLIVAVALYLSAWIIRSILATWRHNKLVKAQADLQSRLLDKLGGSEDIGRYLESVAGRQLLEAPPVERTRPHQRILGSLQAGVILALGGLAFLFLRGQFSRVDGEGFLVAGTLGLALGLGFLASGALSYFLSRSWGLLDGGSERSDA